MDYSKYSKLISKNKEVAPESFNEIKERAIVDMIRGGNSELGIPKRSVDEELAQHRKALEYLFVLIAQLHKGEINIEEFTKYCDDIKTVKAIATKELEVE